MSANCLTWPRSGNKKSSSLTLRLTEEEREKLDRQAKALKTSSSELARKYLGDGMASIQDDLKIMNIRLQHLNELMKTNLDYTLAGYASAAVLILQETENAKLSLEKQKVLMRKHLKNMMALGGDIRNIDFK